LLEEKTKKVKNHFVEKSSLYKEHEHLPQKIIDSFTLTPQLHRSQHFLMTSSHNCRYNLRQRILQALIYLDDAEHRTRGLIEICKTLEL